MVLNSFFKRNFMLSSLVVTAFFTSVLPAKAADEDDSPVKCDDPVLVLPALGQDYESNPVFVIDYPEWRGLILEISQDPEFSTLYYAGKAKWTTTSYNKQTYELPYSFFAPGVYYCRVRATFDGVLDGLSESRCFTIGLISPASLGEYDKDPNEYSAQGRGNHNRDYTLKSLWMRNANCGALGMAPENNIDMVARSAEDQSCDMIYLVSRSSYSPSADSYLLRVEALTGKTMPGLQLSYDEKWSAGSCPANGIMLDDANQLVTHTLAKAGQALSVGTVNPLTGAVTTWFSSEMENQVEHIDVYGTIADNETWYIFAPTNGGVVYRITMNGDVCQNIEEMKINLGNGSRIHAVSPDRFWVNSQQTDPTLYEFGNKYYLYHMSEYSELTPAHTQATDMVTFTRDGESYIFYQYGYTNEADGSTTQWALAVADDVNNTVNDAQLLWVFPKNGTGEHMNIKGDFGAPVSVLHSNAVPADNNEDIPTIDTENLITTQSTTDSDINTYLFGYTYGEGLVAYSLVKNITTAVEDIAVPDSTFNPVMNADGTISLGTDCTNYEVYNAAGSLVAAGNGNTTKAIKAKGLYIVRAICGTCTLTAKVVF